MTDATTLSAARKRVKAMEAAGKSTSEALVECLAEALAVKAAFPPELGTGKAGDPIKWLLDQILDHLKERFAPVTARLDALEGRRLMSFSGPHDLGANYIKGDVVLRAGSLYCALVATTEIPGSSSAWRNIGVAKV